MKSETKNVTRSPMKIATKRVSPSFEAVSAGPAASGMGPEEISKKHGLFPDHW